MIDTTFRGKLQQLPSRITTTTKLSVLRFAIKVLRNSISRKKIYVLIVKDICHSRTTHSHVCKLLLLLLLIIIYREALKCKVVEIPMKMTDCCPKELFIPPLTHYLFTNSTCLVPTCFHEIKND